MRLPRAALSAVFIIPVLLTIWGCGDSTAPENGGVLRGVVLDTQGNPVAGAHINIAYEVVFGFERKPALLSHGYGFYGTREFFDHLGSLVRSYGPAKGVEYVIWDGRYEDGRLVPSGMYKLRLTEVDDTGGVVDVFEKWLPIILSHPTETWMDRTDDAGRFAIPVERAPVWEDYGLQWTNPDSPDPLGPYWLSRTVTVLAHRPGVQDPHAEVVVTFEDPKADISVTLTIPD